MPLNPVALRKTTELFGPSGEEDVPDRLWRRIRRTIWIGCIVGIGFIFAVGLWASLAPVTGAVMAQGVVKVENNIKTVKHLEPGIIRQILVHEGDEVHKGQVLFLFDDSQAKAQVNEFQSAYDSALGEEARFEAEAANRPSITFPPELLARKDDPSVSAIISAQQALFQSRRDLLQSQVQIGVQRQRELATQIDGLRAQVASINAQQALNKDELDGLQTLYAGGYAPKTRILALQRSAASLGGDRGEQVAAIARAQQGIGEAKTTVLQAQQTRITEAATGLGLAQNKVADIGPRLAAAKDILSHAQVVAPTDGTVFNLTQFTEGGVVGVGEPLLQIVPTGQPLVIQVKVKPTEAHAVHPGQKALITLTAYNSRTTPRINADVVTLAADQSLDEHTGKPYFNAELRIPPDQLKRLPKEVKIYPGMPVAASIVNGQRTVMSYLIGPLVDVMRQSMHEQ